MLSGIRFQTILCKVNNHLSIGTKSNFFCDNESNGDYVGSVLRENLDLVGAIKSQDLTSFLFPF